jgi:hypothetical protein
LSWTYGDRRQLQTGEWQKVAIYLVPHGLPTLAGSDVRF